MTTWSLSKEKRKRTKPRVDAGYRWRREEAGSSRAGRSVSREGLYYSAVPPGTGAEMLARSTRWWISHTTANTRQLIYFSLLWLSQRGGRKPLRLTPHPQEGVCLEFMYIKHPTLSKPEKRLLRTDSILTLLLPSLCASLSWVHFVAFSFYRAVPDFKFPLSLPFIRTACTVGWSASLCRTVSIQITGALLSSALPALRLPAVPFPLLDWDVRCLCTVRHSFQRKVRLENACEESAKHKQHSTVTGTAEHNEPNTFTHDPFL